MGAWLLVADEEKASHRQVATTGGIGERVLIFCHNVAPITFHVKMIEIVFGWRLGDEILVLQGDQELPVRSDVMDNFNGDSKGKRKVLIASTTACAEGISLTGASRLVMLDSEWNHSKTMQAIARAFRPDQERMLQLGKQKNCSAIMEGLQVEPRKTPPRCASLMATTEELAQIGISEDVSAPTPPPSALLARDVSTGHGRISGGGLEVVPPPLSAQSDESMPRGDAAVPFTKPEPRTPPSYREPYATTTPLPQGDGATPSRHALALDLAPYAVVRTVVIQQFDRRGPKLGPWP
nr:unnamed protein product [Digitaria exilis]